MTTLPVFASPRERSIWVQAQLRLSNQSFSQIARDNGWSRVVVTNAMYVASNPQEVAIAAALGVSQQELFPERFDRNGIRLHVVRQNKAGRVPRNVKESAVA
ncbi:hypothetical protein AZA_19560 [Nitrospirillum viridazoti Y2]|uniref:Nlp family transcriptional regulator n=1 Tax=Nitrospirillum amazonense TaxID=28077 RepID=A0A560IKY3_9PROT|nr:helix-turn-helix domain-containing protein [Nitrospirillum amazonense]EGX99848.1 hypothetical protein AZA_19560 [Nitrospirillum amazonense Y2]TWB58719.1 Nlp family transcriptional regulator [Nitrospirillum amazonense]